MRVTDYEKLSLSLILNHPNGTENIPQRIISELEPDRYGDVACQKIYRAVQKLVFNNEVPNIINISLALGEDLEGVGGLEYLNSLKGFLELAGVNDYEGFGKWIRIIDNAGRLRHLKDINERYASKLKDFEEVIRTVDDVDSYLSNFYDDISAGIANTRSSYKPFSFAIDHAITYVENVQEGQISDIIPVGWPSLEKYLIPRPETFVVVSGMSSMGKTQFCLQVLYGAALQLKNLNRKGVCSINSLETPGYRLAIRLGCMLARVNSQTIATGQGSQAEKNRLIEKLEHLYDLPIVYDDNPAITTKQLMWEAVALNLKQGRVLSISDYSELFRDATRGDNEELRISSIGRNIKQISRKTGSCEIMISQYPELTDRHKIGGRKARYSRAIFDASEIFIEVWNPVEMRRKNIEFQLPDGKSNDAAYIFIHKNKEYDTGEEMFEWIPEYTLFRDLACGMSNTYENYTEEDLIEDGGYF